MKPAASVADPATVVLKEFSVYTGSSLLLFFCPMPKAHVQRKRQPECCI